MTVNWNHIDFLLADQALEIDRLRTIVTALEERLEIAERDADQLALHIQRFDAAVVRSSAQHDAWDDMVDVGLAAHDKAKELRL